MMEDRNRGGTQADVPSPHPSSIVVIGAGAAGLMAALTAAKARANVVLLDSQQKIGAKILVSGGGRCNVTNEHVTASHFHSGSREFVARVLDAFGLPQTLRFFQDIGVPLKLEPEMGKYFPVSDSAESVLESLTTAVRSSGVRLRCAQNVHEITPGATWTVRTTDHEFSPKAVILCTGGLSLPKSGSTGAGYAMAGKLGHSIVYTTPALSPLLSDSPAHAALSGVTLPVRLTWREHRDVLAEYEGSFLFTHTGYSGPAALNVSRHIARDSKDHPAAALYCRFVPAVPAGGEREFEAYVLSEYRGHGPYAMAARFMPRRVADMVCDAAQVNPRVPMARMPAPDRRRLMASMLDHHLPVTEVDGYRKAEATAGGVSVDEVDPETMMSRIVPGLFLAGEILDVDGQLGGYNFQWAWSSGYVAGRAAAKW
ncbi:MAG TPA: aminoacetone oxidase family FAD-binding enzyme [Armatimonadota bacterium]|jgi:hypothetical protein